ncbi:MAG: phosphoribosylaminoimidazolesuccinocarboxamide synthase [Proteobacteria bacterium]|nr:phosphoribosylaminoimidazolesuccinocarboxamide synthase [Pseudomonadota bacterium]
MTEQIILQTEFKDLKLLNRGKVRDLYDLGDALLMIATDRISAFDVILPNGIPGKGKILTQLSAFWFSQLAGIVPHHLISTRVEDFPAACRQYQDILSGRSMLIKKTKPLPVECVVRGYLSGSGWKDYQKSGTICGIPLPAGLKESDALGEPIFTPSTKAEIGTHDENINFSAAEKLVGKETAARLKQLTIAIYQKARSIAEERGIIIADTKFEFGTLNNEIILIDEVLTPDSSRFWPQDSYAPGKAQNSFDKQFVRDYLLSLTWDQKPPAPTLPAEIIQKTSQRYQEAFRRLTGKEFRG